MLDKLCAEVERIMRLPKTALSLPDCNRVRKNIRCYYAILRVAEDCDLTEVRRAYRDIAVAVHPDKHAHPCAGEAMTLLNSAHEVLSCAQKRRRYDAGLRNQRVEAIRAARQKQEEEENTKASEATASAAAASLAAAEAAWKAMMTAILAVEEEKAAATAKRACAAELERTKVELEQSKTDAAAAGLAFATGMAAATAGASAEAKKAKTDLTHR